MGVLCPLDNAVVARQYQFARGWRNKVKKIVCLIVALMLVFSLCTLTSVAFADETDDDVVHDHEVSVNENAFYEMINLQNDGKGISKLQAMNKEFKLDNLWAGGEDLESRTAAEKLVAKIFSGIKYELSEDYLDKDGKFVESKRYTVKSGSDKLYWEYCSPSKEFKDKWVRSELRSTINASSTGWWGFRYVVMDSEGTTSTSDAMQKHVLARSPAIFVYIADNAAPVINRLHSDMNKVKEDGLAVGSTYTIKTNISVTDTSSTTTTYKVYKKVNGKWDLANPIYDSVTKTVREGFEDCISTSGVITILPSDVLPNSAPAYLIIYTVKDALGYTATTLGNPELELTLFALPEEKVLDAAQIWQIVLYSIAGLAAIGIVVVLCIKPKDVVPEGRPAPKKADKKVEDKKVADAAADTDASDKE